MIADAIAPLLHGAVATLALSLLGTILATIIGVAGAIAAQCGFILRWLVTVYVSFIRGTPLLIQMLIIYYILPAVGVDVPPFGAGVIALGVNGGAHIREIVRGALTAIPLGQIEAARALALPRHLIWTRIILPQVFALVLPPLTVEFSALLKGSALISVIGYVELTRQAQYLLASSNQPFTIWVITALLYFRHVLSAGNPHASRSATKLPPVAGVGPRMSIDISVVTFGLPILLRGLVNTVLFSFAAIAVAMVLGPCVALARLSRRSPLRRPAAVFVEILRNTPFLIQAFLFFYGLAAAGLRVNATLAGILTLSLFGTATFSESFRGAIQSVPPGQMEAGAALGMSYRQAMRLVIFPQTWGYRIPSLTNQATGLIKECSVLSVITVPEIAMAAQFVIGETFSPTETYLMIALIYWALTGAVTGLLSLFRRGYAGTPDELFVRP